MLNSSLPLLFEKTLPEWAPTKRSYVYLINTELHAWAHRQSAYAQLSPFYLLSTLYVTHMINYSRPSPTFPYYKWSRDQPEVPMENPSGKVRLDSWPFLISRELFERASQVVACPITSALVLVWMLIGDN